MRRAPRVWQVTRQCCTSGYCIDCHKNNRLGKPARIVQADVLDKDAAEKMAAGWPLTKGLAERMPKRRKQGV